MMVADGSKKGRADPAFPAHMDVVHHWAQAVWNTWLPRQDLQTSIDFARKRISNAQRPWAVVHGPAAALICTLQRVGWTVTDATHLTTDEGKQLDLTLDPPVVVNRAMEASVRRWRWKNFHEAHPSMNNTPCNFDPILKLLTSKRHDPEWNHQLRAALKSTVTNRQ